MAPLFFSLITLKIKRPARALLPLNYDSISFSVCRHVPPLSDKIISTRVWGELLYATTSHDPEPRDIVQ